MNKVTKFFYILLSIVGLLQVTWFIVLVYPLEGVNRFIKSLSISNQIQQKLGLTLGTLVGIIFCYLLIRAILFPSKNQSLIIQTDHGKLEFSKKAVENMIISAITEEYPVTNLTVNLELLGKKKKVKGNIRALTSSHINLKETANAMKLIVENVLTKTFELPIKHINVYLDPDNGLEKQSKVVKHHVV